jgi:hypothetical protein
VLRQPNGLGGARGEGLGVPAYAVQVGDCYFAGLVGEGVGLGVEEQGVDCFAEFEGMVVSVVVQSWRHSIWAAETSSARCCCPRSWTLMSMGRCWVGEVDNASLERRWARTSGP